MPQLQQLVPKENGNTEVRMSTMGHLLWICWQGKLPAAINQTLSNYGGLIVYERDDQAIWFFFTDEIFLALARLIIWGNLNILPIVIEVFPGRLQLDRKGEISLLIDATMQNQEMIIPDRLEVWVHGKSCEGRKAIPGIEFNPVRARRGMSNVNWFKPVVDSRMPFASTQSWIVVLHPLGRPLDKKFSEGWYTMFKQINTLLQEHKIKSIVDTTFVLLSMDNLLVLRAFMRDYMSKLSEWEANGTYWPCVCAIVDRNNLNFSSDIPQKVNLHWDRLVAGFPYISYRNAYLLGKGFIVRDLHFNSDQMTMDEWCNILLDDNSATHETLPVMIAGQLTDSEQNKIGDCFYCGIASHTAAQCPTRSLEPPSKDIWERMGRLDLDVINKSFQELESKLGKKGLAAYKEILEEKSPTSTLLEALLDLSPLCQLRNLPYYWLSRMRVVEEGEALPKKEDNPGWEVLDALIKIPNRDYRQLEDRISDLIDQHPRDAQLYMLRAFLCVEKGDYDQAEKYFHSAGGLLAQPSMQAWCEYLAARIVEERGHYADAIQQYLQVARIIPNNPDPRYRAIVCRVKMGFAEQALDDIVHFIHERPTAFNRFLIDPGLERGRILILSTLHSLWEEARKKAAADQNKTKAMLARFNKWFPEDHPVHAEFSAKLQTLEKLSKINNFAAFLRVVEVRSPLEVELDEYIEQEIDDLREHYKKYLDALQVVRDEASWFPFPTALREFSKDFNEAAGIINWAYSCNFSDVEVFREAENAIPQMNKILRKLRKRLNTLRFVRDATLFVMTMSKTFLLLEIAGLTLVLALVLSIGFFGDILHLGWLKSLIADNKVSILKVLAVVVTVLTLGIGALRTTLIFDSQRDKLLKKAREAREKDQEQRLEQVKQKKRMEIEKALKAKREEERLEMRRELRERMGG